MTARADLAQVVRRDVGGHPDRDPGRAVDQQVRDPRRQHHRLGGLVVVVGDLVDGVLEDPGQHQHGQRGQPALGVPHGGGRVVAHRPEVALAVDHRVPQRPRLRHPDHGVVDRRVTVRVVVAHHVADDPGGLHRGALRPEAGVEHPVQHPAVHRLEPVPDVGQRARDDDAHRVVDERALHFVLDVDRFGAIVLGSGRACHVEKPSVSHFRHADGGHIHMWTVTVHIFRVSQMV